MKPVLLLVVIIGTLSAQNSAIIGGVTYSTVFYNSAELRKVADATLLTGFVVGTESTWGKLRLGGLYIQQGFISKVAATDNTIEGSETFNYLMPYVIYAHPLKHGSFLFGGFGLGTALGGKSVDADGESSLKARLFNLDTQLMAGFDVTLSRHFTMRSNVYVGLRDVIVGLDSDLNYRNLCVSLAAVYRR